ncbi:hypothetical protein SDC9_156116 [bioreactor metagenome]|uniref:Uncharacterized protein n=1 Tax=bioreactor metagenome TaxID=1076179 RepID=A0A645F4P6_9ZZZZ
MNGLEFYNDNGVKLTVYGNNNAVEHSVDTVYNEVLEKAINVSYKQQSGNWYAVSWIQNDKIIYQKGIVGKGSINTLIFQYPISEKDVYDEFLQKLDSYFQTPKVDEAH